MHRDQYLLVSQKTDKENNFFFCLCKCKNKSTLYSPSHPPTHICIHSNTHTRRLICTPRGQLPVNGLLGPLIFFPSARPRPVSLFDLVGCYPAKPAPPPQTHIHPSSSQCRRQKHQRRSMYQALEETNSAT